MVNGQIIYVIQGDIILQNDPNQMFNGWLNCVVSLKSLHQIL